MRAFAVLALGLLAGCASSPEGPTRQGVSFVPDAAGLSVAGREARVDFGRAPEGVITTLTRELGRPRDLGVSGCPAGIARQIAFDDLTLTFTAARFVGWSQAGASAGQSCA